MTRSKTRRSRFITSTSRARTAKRVEARKARKVIPVPVKEPVAVKKVRKPRKIKESTKKELRATLGPKLVAVLETNPEKIGELKALAKVETKRAANLIARIKAKKVTARNHRSLAA